MPYCSTCGTQISAATTTCPTCGHPQGPPPYAVPQRADGQAVAALILGIVGLTMCPFVPSIIAVIIGNQARARLAVDPSLRGDELARVGVILGWIGIAIGGIGIVGAIIAFAFSLTPIL